MNDINIQKSPPKPLWISHRGYKLRAPENTREAFRAAVEIGFTTLETDLRLTRDGHIVLHHDPHLGRLGGQRGLVIHQCERRDLEPVTLVSEQFHLFFLEDFLKEFVGCSWVFDIKPETGDGVLIALADLARKRGMLDLVAAQTTFVTWRAQHEELARKLFPKAACYARESECWRAGLSVLARLPALGGIRAGRTYALPPRLRGFELYRPEVTAMFHRRGARVLAFLPEVDEDVWRALACGFDEVLTNGRRLDVVSQAIKTKE